MKRDYSAFCDRGASWTEEYVALPTGVELRSVTFTPAVPTSALPVIFIPGVGSIIENFREAVIALTRNHIVLYIEPREKASARISRKHRFSVEDITTGALILPGALPAQTTSIWSTTNGLTLPGWAGL